jgi:hypothetical protein
MTFMSILDVPPSKWPLLLVMLCGAILGGLLFCCLLKAIMTGSGPDPTDKTGKDDKQKLREPDL